MKVTGSRMEPQINSLSVVTDDVFSTWVLVIATSHELLESENANTFTSLSKSL